MRVSWKRFGIPAALVVVLVTLWGCMDRDSPVAPLDTDVEVDTPDDTPRPLLGTALRCSVTVASGEMVCSGEATGEPGHDGIAAMSGNLILGGQNEFVRLISTSPMVSTANDTFNWFTAWVRIENLIAQALGTEDGLEAHELGIRVFFSRYPEVTGGTGTVDVWPPPPNQTAFFTEPGQSYVPYPQMLGPGELSSSVLWRWIYTNTVTSFDFEVLVSAEVQFRQGWLAVEEEVLQVDPGEPTGITLTAYDVLGRVQENPAIEWSVADPEVVTVGADGTVEFVSAGFTNLTATSGTRSVTVPVVAGEVVPVISGISPATLSQGTSGVITGSNFNTFWEGGTTLSVGGTPVVITSLTETVIEFQVAPSTCHPSGEAPVVVGNGSSTAEVGHPFTASTPVSLAVGTQAILTGPESLCLSFDESAAEEAYLIGVQRVSGQHGVTTAVEVNALSMPGPFLARALAPEGHDHPPVMALDADDGLTPEARRLLEEHYRFKAENPDLRGTFGGPSSAIRTPRIPGVAMATDPPPAVGEILTEYSVTSGNFCTSPAIIQVEVRKVTPNAIFLEDVDNPARLSDEVIDGWMDFFETHSYPAIVSVFGEPSDIDNNGRVKFLSTKELNKMGPLGYVTTADWESRANCGASSEGEIFYTRGLDPEGIHGPVVTEAGITAVFDRVLAHEYVHVIQFGRRIDAGSQPVGGPFLSNWEAEGQATFAEMVVGMAAEGRSMGQDYGYAVAGTFWYGKTFFDYRRYFGWAGGENRTEGAPEQCNWLQYTQVPCIIWLNYAVPSLLIQYLSDHFGLVAVNSGMIDGTTTGFPNLEEVTGLTTGEMLARWGAALYVDGRIPGADAELTLPSWNLHDIWGGFTSDAQRLQPRERGFTSFSDALTNHSASTAYFRVSGTGRNTTAIAFRSPGGGLLPAEMQVWIVRLQ
jgi:hypothetical protein